MSAHRHLSYMTSAQALGELKLLNPIDAISAIRRYVEEELSESYGMCSVLDGLDRCEEDYRDEPTGSVLVLDQRSIGSASYVELRA